MEDILKRRFKALPRAVRRRLLRAPTLVDAVRETLTHIYDTPAHVGRMVVTGNEPHVVAFRLSGIDDTPDLPLDVPGFDPKDDHAAVILVDSGLCEQWAARGARWPRSRRYTYPRRRLLAAALFGAFVEPYGINDNLVELSYRDNDAAKWYLAQVSFPLWWDTRVEQGHTAEAATFVLGLTVQPQWLARLAFENDRLVGVTPFPAAGSDRFYDDRPMGRLRDKGWRALRPA